MFKNSSSRRFLLFFALFASLLFLPDSEARNKPYELIVSGGYAGSVQYRNSLNDFYENLIYQAALGIRSGRRNQILLIYNYSEQRGNYLDLDPPNFKDHVGSLALRRVFGGEQVFVQIGGDVHSAQSTINEIGYGGHIAGGLRFRLTRGGRMSLGITTLYAIRRFQTSSTTRRFLNQTADLGIRF